MASTYSGNSSQSLHPVWPPEPIQPVGYLSRKALPIKRNDAEPLTRTDVQFDLLQNIFSNAKAVFTAQAPAKTAAKVTFSDLYVNALYNSSKCSKVLKDKMIDTPAFAIELAKISLLTNVGRINTTMAFFPEMKTALRTYHPVPSLQKTDGNAQDAPRIKNCLKAALLPAELRTLPPTTPEEILEKCRAGQRPPTSVVNLVFVLSNHAAPLASVHFDGSLNFLDLFLPRDLSSVDRAGAFLWLIYHYLEGPDQPNPFDDEYSRKNKGQAPLLRRLSDAAMRKENVDTPEEIEWGIMMSGQRNIFLQKLVSSVEFDKKGKSSAPHFVSAPDTTANQHRSRLQRQGLEGQKDGASFMYYVPNQEMSPPRNRSKAESRPQQSRTNDSQREERTMLEHAWHTVTTSDPLLDSDEENPDEHVRLDYTRRLGIITRIRDRLPMPDQITILSHGIADRQEETAPWERRCM